MLEQLSLHRVLERFFCSQIGKKETIEGCVSLTCPWPCLTLVRHHSHSLLFAPPLFPPASQFHLPLMYQCSFLCAVQTTSACLLWLHCQTNNIDWLIDWLMTSNKNHKSNIGQDKMSTFSLAKVSGSRQSFHSRSCSPRQLQNPNVPLMQQPLSSLHCFFLKTKHGLRFHHHFPPFVLGCNSLLTRTLISGNKV